MTTVERVAMAICDATGDYQCAGRKRNMVCCHNEMRKAKAAIQALIDAEWPYDGLQHAGSERQVQCRHAKAFLKQMMEGE